MFRYEFVHIRLKQIVLNSQLFEFKNSVANRYLEDSKFKPLILYKIKTQGVLYFEFRVRMFNKEYVFQYMKVLNFLVKEKPMYAIFNKSK